MAGDAGFFEGDWFKSTMKTFALSRFLKLRAGLDASGPRSVDMSVALMRLIFPEVGSQEGRRPA